MLVTWHRAAEYCNWLSKHEKIPEDQWCYKIDKKKTSAIPCADYLKRTGYRLPTDVEWEYACRAGTATAFSWGNDPMSFPRFSFTLQNSQGHDWPVGSLCPNRFGLFDMHGNAAEWVQDRYEFQDGKPIIKTGEDTEETDWWITDDSPRDIRGGAGSKLRSISPLGQSHADEGLERRLCVHGFPPRQNSDQDIESVRNRSLSRGAGGSNIFRTFQILFALIDVIAVVCPNMGSLAR